MSRLPTRLIFMIKIKDDVKIISIDGIYSDNKNVILSIYLNTKNTIIAPKSFLNSLFLFNGLHKREDVERIMALEWGTQKSKSYIQEFIDWKIIEESAVTKYCVKQNGIDFLGLLSKSRVYLDETSNLSLLVAALLCQIGVNEICFSSDKSIDIEDIQKNLFLSEKDIGKNFSDVVRNIDYNDKTKIIYNSTYPDDFAKDDVVVHFSQNRMEDQNSYLLINAWDYKSIANYGFELFRGNINISSEIQAMVLEYLWAVRIYEDILFSIGNGTYF